MSIANGQRRLLGFPETRRALRRLHVAIVDYLAARAGFHLVPDSLAYLNGHVLFSVRSKVSRAIADPGQYFERLRTPDGLVETLDHWQARAAIEAMMQSVASSPSFASAIEAATAGETVKLGSTEGESAVPEGQTPKDRA